MSQDGWIEAAAGRIFLKLPFKYKAVCKAIPACKWEKDRKVWSYPGTPAVARAAFKALGQMELEVDDRGGSVAELINHGAFAHMAIDPDITPPPIPKWWGPDPPRECQTRAFWFATYRKAAMLGLDMGAGKSAVIVAFVGNHPDIRLTLIQCPHGVIEVWPEQFQIWGPGAEEIMVVPLFKGSTKKKTEMARAAVERAARLGRKLVIVINFEAAWRPPFGPDYDDNNRIIDRGFALNTEWDLTVLDESHRIKKPGGKSSWFCARLRDHSRYRIPQTGTPLPHQKFDAYGQYRYMDPAIFGTNYTTFKARFAELGGFGGKEVIAYRNEDEFNKKLHSAMYRVEIDEVVELPPFVHERRTCELNARAQRINADLEADLYAFLDEGGELTPANALVRQLRFAQITSGHVKNDDGELIKVDDAKKKLLKETIEDLPDDEPVVVFSRFSPDIEAAHEVAKSLGRVSCEMSGSRKEKHLFTGKELLQDGTYRYFDPPADFIAVNVRSGSLGIDLTRARYAIYFSLGWSLGDYEQSLRRLRRPGQERAVFYIHLVASGTVDEAVYRGLKSKGDIIKEVLDYFKNKRVA